MALQQIARGAGLFSRLLSALRGGPPQVDTSIARRNMAALQRDFERRVTVLARGLTANRIDVGQLQVAGQDEIRRYDAAIVTIAAGGRDQVDSSDFRLASEHSDRQIGFWSNWMNQLRQELGTRQSRLPTATERSGRGDPDVPPFLRGGALTVARQVLQEAAGVGRFTEADFPRISNRARLYAGAGNELFERVLQTAQLEVELPFFPADRTLCRTSCKCRWDIVAVAGGFDCFWKLAAAEHCDTCLPRAVVANPLRIREGAIVDAGRYTRGVLFA